MDDKNIQQESSISLKQVIILLFGNVKRYLIVLTISLIVTFGVLFFVKRNDKSYTSMFNFNVAGLTKETYIDGSKFDCHDLVTLSKLKQYKEEHTELQNVDMVSVYYEGGIEEFKYEVIYKESDSTTTTTKQENKEILKEGYYISLAAKYFTKEQAGALIEAIANEPLRITKEKINDLKYNEYLKLYQDSKKYDEKVEYLEQQLKLVNSRYDSLIKTYGDVKISYSNNEYKLSDLKVEVKNVMQNHDLDLIKAELQGAGYVLVDTTDTEKVELNTKLEQYTKEKQNYLDKQEIIKAEISSLDGYVTKYIEKSGTSTSSLQSLELDAYQTRITELIKEDSEITSSLQTLNKRIANVSLLLGNKTGVDSVTHTDYYEIDEKQYYLYTDEKLGAFDSRLEGAYTALEMLTNQLTAVAKSVCNERTSVYYLQSGILSTSADMEFTTIVLISVAVAIFLPMIVNCIVAIVKTVNESEKEIKEEKINNKKSI